MTDLLYQTDSYIREFEAVVTKVDLEQNAVILDRTAFYPGGGGQVFDQGEICFDGTVSRLKRAKKTESGLLHIIEDGESLPVPGNEIKGVIDWERRYQVMRTHTAMHILCGVIFRDYGVLVTGGNMQPLKGRMDFEFESMTGELVGTIEAAINREVQADREVHVSILPREDALKIPDLIRTKINLLPKNISEIRTIEIVGLDLQADGGTHVRSSREVGAIKISGYKSKGKINKRIYIELQPEPAETQNRIMG